MSEARIAERQPSFWQTVPGELCLLMLEDEARAVSLTLHSNLFKTD